MGFIEWVTWVEESCIQKLPVVPTEDWSLKAHETVILTKPCRVLWELGAIMRSKNWHPKRPTTLIRFTKFGCKRAKQDWYGSNSIAGRSSVAAPAAAGSDRRETCTIDAIWNFSGAGLTGLNAAHRTEVLGAGQINLGPGLMVRSCVLKCCEKLIPFESCEARKQLKKPYNACSSSLRMLIFGKCWEWKLREVWLEGNVLTKFLTCLLEIARGLAGEWEKGVGRLGCIMLIMIAPVTFCRRHWMAWLVQRRCRRVRIHHVALDPRNDIEQVRRIDLFWDLAIYCPLTFEIFFDNDLPRNVKNDPCNVLHNSSLPGAS